MKVLVPIEDATCTTTVVDFLVGHPKTIGDADDFTLMFVSAPIPMRVLRDMSDDDVQRHYAAEAETATATALRRLQDVGWTVRAISSVGVPCHEICREAIAGAYELIVMGVRPRGAIASLLLDTTSHGILAGCRVPVLLVR